MSKNILFYSILILSLIIIYFNIYDLAGENKKAVFKSKYTDIIKDLQHYEYNYIGTKTNTILNNIKTGIVWIRNGKDCQECVQDQEIILKKITKLHNLKLYLYLDGYDDRSRQIMAINYNLEDRLLEQIESFRVSFPHSPLLLFIENNRVVLSNIGYIGTQYRVEDFISAVDRLIN
jgi:hypothetical protein